MWRRTTWQSFPHSHSTLSYHFHSSATNITVKMTILLLLRYVGCFLQSVKRSSSLDSSMDNRVVGHNSGLILGIKDHNGSDTVCPIAAYMLITQFIVNVL